MQKEQFEEAIKRIKARDARFEREAFFFLKEALDYTVQDVSVKSPENSKHVSAAQLLYGFRDLALKEFGPMASTLFSEWGIHRCADIGDMVFMLIQEGVFGKQDNDRQEDFVEIFTFESAFVAPFLPQSVGKVT
ncbi:MAG: Minf_1886 family protein [Akkermansiaceae bacterium]